MYIKNNDNAETETDNVKPRLDDNGIPLPSKAEWLIFDPFDLWFEYNAFSNEYVSKYNYPDNVKLSARDRPGVKVIPYVDDVVCINMYWSYLFPEAVRCKYKDIATTLARVFIKNPNTPDYMKNLYVYNDDILCIPRCHLPYYYRIALMPICEDQCEKF